MTSPETNDSDTRESHPSWIERDASGRHAALTGILAQVSIEALQGETLEAILQRIVDCVTHRLPVTIASIILLNDERTHFVQEVWAGRIELDLPSGLPWPVTVGAAGRCARTGEAQLIADVQHDPDYVSGNREVSSEYLVPIRHREPALLRSGPGSGMAAPFARTALARVAADRCRFLQVFQRRIRASAR